MKWRRIGLVVGLLLVVTAAIWGWQQWASRPVDLSTLSASQWRADLSFLARELPRRHANAFHNIRSQDFDRIVTEIDNSIPNSDPADMPVQLLKLTAAVGDGHTQVLLPRSTLRYPIRFYWFGDQLRVIRTTTATQAALASQLTAINDLSLSEITGRLRKIISQDENQWLFLDLSPYLMVRPEVLHALGIVTDKRQARFTFTNDAGGRTELLLVPTTDQPNDWHDAYASAPLYLQHQNDDFWFRPIANTNVVYVVFNHYDWLFFYARKLFQYLDAHPGSKLVIDMRNNGGGDYHVGHWCLIRSIVQRPSLNRAEKLFVITGRATFSAAMNNAAQFRMETNATVIGEPPGEVPNSYQEARSFILPNSHLTIRYSARYYRFLRTDSKALIPDQQIPPDWDSYRNGSDPVLDYVLKQTTTAS
jgi:hypothetical protein